MIEKFFEKIGESDIFLIFQFFIVQFSSKKYKNNSNILSNVNICFL